MVDAEIVLTAVGAGSALVLSRRAFVRLRLSRAKHRSLAGHARMGKRLAQITPHYEFDRRRFFRADNPPDAIASQREKGFDALCTLFHQRFPVTSRMSADAGEGLSDVRFTGAYRVPFPFSRIVRESLPVGNFYNAAHGVSIFDLDGNAFYDLTGSYGVNLLGTDRYKRLIKEGAKAVEEFGPVLAGLHPVVADNVRRLRAISGLDEVSFHMSGTEAVMQAVRLARYHTGRSHLVRFAGAYHGWWGDVQPGVGNPLPADHTYTLADMSERSLKVIETRKDIACVLVNPLQALHPNRGAPGDSTLMAARAGKAATKADYADWLAKLAQSCQKAGVVLIVDEVFTGFRLAPRGACEYFGVKPDMVTYGKTLGGGMPVGVLCGRADLMKRYRDDRPADICFARGTFNSHPFVMGAMDAFLRYMETPAAITAYEGLDDLWTARAEALSRKLAAEDIPVSISNLGTIWTINYDRASRYHWMLQYYLRAQGLALSWVGTGRLIFNFAFTDVDFAEVSRRFVAAARAMKDDGWWWMADDNGKTLKRQLAMEMIVRMVRRK